MKRMLCLLLCLALPALSLAELAGSEEDEFDMV